MTSLVELHTAITLNMLLSININNSATLSQQHTCHGLFVGFLLLHYTNKLAAI